MMLHIKTQVRIQKENLVRSLNSKQSELELPDYVNKLAKFSTMLFVSLYLPFFFVDDGLVESFKNTSCRDQNCRAN